MSLVLDVERLSIEIGGASILRDVTFQVEAGTSLLVIGPNGAGKTVLFRALIGAIPSRGAIRWAPGVRLGYVPQKLDIERDVPITGCEFLNARADLDGVAPDEIERVLRLVGLTPATSRFRIGALSGGQFQRLLVAFALLGRPTVLLLDEPTAGVDAPGEMRLNALLQQLQREQGLTILLISHELSIVNAHATNVLCLGGEQACFGPPTILTPERLAAMFGPSVALYVHAH